MIRPLLGQIRSRFRAGNPTSDGDDAEDEDAAENESGFVPSQLDASVLFAHGKGDETERAIADVEEQAKALEGRDRQ
jgi:hypothetical protein